MFFRRIIFLFAFVSICSVVQARSFSSAIIKYNDGQFVVYVDGQKMAMETYNKKGALSSTSFYDGAYAYSIGFEGFNIATKLSKEQFHESVVFLQTEPLRPEDRREAVLDRECKVYMESFKEGEDETIDELFYWNGLILRRNTKLSMMGQIMETTISATSIETDVPVPQEKFILPQGVKLMSQDEAMQDFENKVKEKLMSR